jgi:hypothetical protein
MRVGQTRGRKRLHLLRVGAFNVGYADVRRYALRLIAFVLSEIVAFFDAGRKT